MASRRRRRRRRRGFAAPAEGRRDRWGQAVAGILVASGLTAAIAAPVDDSGARNPLRLLRAGEALGPSGLHVGPVVVSPSLGVSGVFDSNLFAAPDGAERSDWLAVFTPGIDIESDLPRHAFSLRAQGEFRRYLTYERESANNASVAATGRIDLAPNAHLLAGGSYQLLHEDRGALVPVNGIAPTQFTVASGKVGLVVEPAPFGLRLDATVDSFGYSDVALFGGAVARESARDRIVYALQPRIAYRVAPQYDLFLGAIVNRRQYNSARLPDGLGRSSTGFAARLGGAFDLAGFAAGEVYLGYLNQNYRTAAARPIGAVDFGGTLEWRSIEDAALRLNVSRSIEESAILGAPGLLQTAIRIGGEQALSPRVALLGSLGYINADFAGTTGSSNLFQAVVGVRYLLAAEVSAGLDYNLAHRASSATLPNYTRHVIELRLRGQL